MDKMEIVPVEDKMNAVANAAPSKIGRVRESDIDTTEETTTTEITQDTPELKHEEQSENYEAQGTAKVVGAKGFTESSADVKSSKSASRTETDEGDRKGTPIAMKPPELPIENPDVKNTTHYQQQQPSTAVYKPLPTIKPFELLKPFEPTKTNTTYKPFEPLKPFEPPKSFEIASQLIKNISLTNNGITNGYDLTNSVDEHHNSESQVFAYGPKTTFKATNNSVRAKLDQPQTNTINSITNNEPLKFSNETSVGRQLDHVTNYSTEEYSSFEAPSFTAQPNAPSKNRLVEVTKTYADQIPSLNTSPLDGPAIPLKTLETPIIKESSKPTKGVEIKEEKIKNTLREIISEIDTYAEKDKELIVPMPLSNRLDISSGVSNNYSKTTIENSSEIKKNTQVLWDPSAWIARLPSCLPKSRPFSLPSDFILDITNNNKESKEYCSSNYSYGNNLYKPDENAYSPINLEKIFTPARDAPQITPCQKKNLFASSAFYAKGLHPTMEEQVELARRISSSLSDVSNQTSKGQSMYVNRKKRSVKWVHEGEGKANGVLNGLEIGCEGSDENKPLIKLVMNPRGKVQDIYSLRKQGFSIDAALSPEVCQEIVRDLNSPKGKGAELFAKRRKRSEKWIVGETEGTRPAGKEEFIVPAPKPLLSPLVPPASNLPTPSYLPETVQRVHHHQKLDKIQERFSGPRVKLIKSPWDAALETGSVEAAFEDVAPAWPSNGNFVKPTVDSYEKALKSDSLETWGGAGKSFSQNPAYNSNSINRMVDNFQKGVSNVDVYKPKLPQAWNTAQPQQYSSVSLATNATAELNFNADDDRPTSPFPFIPDVTLNPEIIPETVSNPIITQPILYVQETASSDTLERETLERPVSPFPRIPDVNMESEVLEQDVEKCKMGEYLESSLQSNSPFPEILDIMLNPDVIEKDLVVLRTTPVPVDDTNIEEEPSVIHNTEEPEVEENKPGPFPTIPDYSRKPDLLHNLPKPFCKQSPMRSFAPVSLTKKKYTLQPEIPIKTETNSPLKPEYALSDTEYKVVERSYSNTTASSMRSLQSELFESQGHFNASGTCSPFPVFIPSGNSTPIPKNFEVSNTSTRTCNVVQEMAEQTNYIAEETKPKQQPTSVKQQVAKQCRVEYSQLDDDSEVKKMLFRMKKVQFGLNSNESEDIDQSFTEENSSEIMQNAECAYSNMDEREDVSMDTFVKIIAHTQGENENSVEVMEKNKERKCAGFLSENIETIEHSNIGEDICGTVERTSTAITSKASTALQEGLTETKERLQEKINYKQVIAQAPMEQEEEEKPKCRKPPESVIGARPLFGQLDINAEIKKAIVGKRSLQGKRANQQTLSVSEAEPRIKIEKSETKSSNQFSSEKLSSQLTTNEKAEIKTIAQSKNEEIQQVYYERDRELEMDFQIIQEEIVMPDGTIVPLDQKSVGICYPKEEPPFADGNTALLSDRTLLRTSEQFLRNAASTEFDCSNYSNSSMDQIDTYTDNSEIEEENYQKIPVKSLIKNFEQCSMPPMRYKQIKDVALDNVSFYEQQQPLQTGPRHDDILRKAEEDFENLYYVASTAVETKHFYNPVELNQYQGFKQSENSSFCKYFTSNQEANLSQFNQSFMATSQQSYRLLEDAALHSASELIIEGGPATSPLPSANPCLVRTPSYKSEAPLTVYVPKEPELLSPRYSTPVYNAHRGGSVPPVPSPKNYSFNNYNTIPRGWGQQGSNKPYNSDY